MHDERKTKKQLIEELKELRRRNSELEKAEGVSKQAGVAAKKELSAMAAVVTDMLSGEVDDAKTEERVMDACLAATDSSYGMIGVINEQGKYDTTTYSSRTLQDCAFPEALAWEVSTGMTIRGIWGWPMLHGEPLICNHLEVHPDRVGFPKGHVPLRCFLGVPLKSEGKVVGMVAVANKPDSYAREDKDTLIRLASVISVSRQHRLALMEAKRTSAELEAFAYSVSHDLRAPLRAIGGFAQMIVEDYSGNLDDDGRRKLQVIQDSTKDMGQLIDALLAFSRLSRKELRKSTIHMGKLAEEIFEKLQHEAPDRNIRFHVETLPPSRGDQTLIREVLTNLLINAIKFTRSRETAVIEVNGRTEGNEHIFSVKDNGVGFDMQYIDKLFKVFQRLHRTEEFEGTGIGLALVQRIIHRHGGRIWAEGIVDKGATFHFALPRQ